MFWPGDQLRVATSKIDPAGAVWSEAEHDTGRYVTATEQLLDTAPVENEFPFSVPLHPLAESISKPNEAENVKVVIAPLETVTLAGETVPPAPAVADTMNDAGVGTTDAAPSRPPPPPQATSHIPIRRSGTLRTENFNPFVISQLLYLST